MTINREAIPNVTEPRDDILSGDTTYLGGRSRFKAPTRSMVERSQKTARLFKWLGLEPFPQDAWSIRRRSTVSRIACAAVATAALVTGGQAVAAQVTQDPFDKYDCVGTHEAVLGQGDTVWDDVAGPLAERLGLNDVRDALFMVEQVNPDVDLGNTKFGETVNVPSCPER